VVAGETGAASLAGLVQAAGVLPPDATALVLCTEGATDPVAYREIVGTAP
jgi:threonine dehydratase